MNSRSQARLAAALSFAIASVAAGLAFGWALALSLALVALVALVAEGRAVGAAGSRVMALHILVIVATLANDSARLGFGATAALRDGLPLAGGAAPLTDRSWFIGLVVLPVSVMLLGGYLLGRGYPGGAILGWWTPLFAVADGLWGLALGPRLDWTRPVASTIVLVAALAQVLIATRAVQARLRRDPTGTEPTAGTTEAGTIPPEERQPAERTESTGLTLRQRNLWTLLMVAMVVVYALSLYHQAGLLPLGVIGGSMVGGMVGWRKTTAHQPADPAYHVPLFLLLLALFSLHVGEEELTGFNRAIAAISGTPWSDSPFTLLIGLIGPTVWVFGAWSLWKRQPFGNFILWFMIVGMILGEPTHLLVFPVLDMARTGGDYHYFSGMYTALFPMVPAIIALVNLVRVHRARTRRAHERVQR
jgi:hypothetical protein